MKLIRFVLINIFLICSVAVLTTSCAASRKGIVLHSFDFDLASDESDADILDYQYGSEGQFGTYLDKNVYPSGETIRNHGIFGSMPRGEYIYVKWRNIETKTVYEDRVDLRKILPADITHFGIHISIKGPQLFVYLTPPPGVFPSTYMRASASPGEKRWIKKAQIYPDREN